MAIFFLIGSSPRERNRRSSVQNNLYKTSTKHLPYIVLRNHFAKNFPNGLDWSTLREERSSKLEEKGTMSAVNRFIIHGTDDENEYNLIKTNPKSLSSVTIRTRQKILFWADWPGMIESFILIVQIQKRIRILRQSQAPIPISILKLSGKTSLLHPRYRKMIIKLLSTIFPNPTVVSHWDQIHHKISTLSLPISELNGTPICKIIRANNKSANTAKFNLLHHAILLTKYFAVATQIIKSIRSN